MLSVMLTCFCLVSAWLTPMQEIEGVARYERVASISAAKALRLQEVGVL